MVKDVFYAHSQDLLAGFNQVWQGKFLKLSGRNYQIGGKRFPELGNHAVGPKGVHPVLDDFNDVVSCQAQYGMGEVLSFEHPAA